MASGMAAEVSSAGWRKPVGEQYPALGLLERFVARGVPLTTASDAHRLEHVADRADDLRAVLAAAGADALQGYRGRAAYPVPVSASVPVGGGGLMPTPAELALSHTDLKPEELEHLQRLLGSWSVLADLSFSDLLLLVPVHADRSSGTAPSPDETGWSRPRRTPSWSCSARCGRTTGPRWSTRTWSARR